MDIILVLHVLGVVFWIGGVGFATMIIFPTIQSMDGSIEKARLFLGVEKRFSRLAKGYVVAVGITGLMLFLRRGGLEDFGSLSILMLGFKIFVWLVFFILLFGAEKHIMKALVSEHTDIKKAFRRMNIFHWFMLTLSGIAIIFGIEL